MKSIKKSVEKLERLAGIKQDRHIIFITSYVENAPNCKECPEPNAPYWKDKSFVVFPNQNCNCESPIEQHSKRKRG